MNFLSFSHWLSLTTPMGVFLTMNLVSSKFCIQFFVSKVSSENFIHLSQKLHAGCQPQVLLSLAVQVATPLLFKMVLGTFPDCSSAWLNSWPFRLICCITGDCACGYKNELFSISQIFIPPQLQFINHFFHTKVLSSIVFQKKDMINYPPRIQNAIFLPSVLRL